MSIVATALMPNDFLFGNQTFEWAGASRVCDKPVCEAMFKTFAANKAHVEVDTAYLYAVWQKLISSAVEYRHSAPHPVII